MATYSNITARADRRRRFSALLVTIAFHAALLAFFISGSGDSWQDKLPTVVKDAFGIEDSSSTAPEEEVADVRP